MRTARTIFAILAIPLLALSLNAQSNADLGAQWRAKVKPPYELSSLKESLKIAERFPDGDPRLFESLIRLAAACEEEDCEEQIGSYLDRAFRMLPKVKPQDGHFAQLLMDLGSAAADQGRYPSALAAYRDALSIREKAFGAESQPAAETYAAMARVYQSQGDRRSARSNMNYALELRERAHQQESAGFAELLDDSARIYRDAGDQSRSESDYERAISIRERLWGPGDPRFVKALDQTARENWGPKGAPFAEKLYKRIAEIQKANHTEQSKAYYDALADLGRFQLSANHYTDAEQVFQQALALRQSSSKDAAYCWEQIARCRLERGMYRESAEAGERSLELIDSIKNPAERAPANVDGLLAEAYLRAHDVPKSESHFRALDNNVRPYSRFLLISTADKLSAIYQERGDYPAAASKLEVSIAAMEAANPSNPQLPQKEVRLAQLYQRMGRAADANRMNIAVLRGVGQSIKQQAGSKALRYALIGLLVIFFLMPVAGTSVFGLLFAWLARRADRKLTSLYIEHEEPVPQERAYVGGFLGLTEITVAEPAPLVMAAAAAAAPVAIEIAMPAESAPVVEPVPEPTAPELPVSQVTLRADGSDLFAMRVLNLLLSLLTLGIYSFWGKAKVRRYVCGQAEYQGDWFAFHGTGRELLLGWLRALPALAFIFLFPTVLPLFWQHRAAPFVAELSAIALVGLLWPVARVGAYRYRLNRMSWRAIRFSYRGRAWRYFGASILGFLFGLITLGIYVPFVQVRLRKLLLNGTYFGDRAFEFRGRGADLAPAWFFALPLTICSFGIGWAWWRAFAHRYCWAHTTFAGARFRCTATGGKLLWLWVGNFLVVVPTLGLGMSWAMLRTLRFWTKHIELVKEPELVSIQQDARAATAIGESFADFLGFDFGF